MSPLLTGEFGQPICPIPTLAGHICAADLLVEVTTIGTLDSEHHWIPKDSDDGTYWKVVCPEGHTIAIPEDDDDVPVFTPELHAKVLDILRSLNGGAS